MKDRVYSTGLIIIAISLIACFIDFYLTYYGMFMFGIGVLFIWFSKKTVKTKLFSTFLPIIFYLPIDYLFVNYTPPKAFLIPADFEGTIRIVYEENCGQKLHKENGIKILQIPESGILVLNEKFDAGRNNEYYLVNKSGRRTKVEQIISLDDRPKHLPSIQNSFVGIIGSKIGNIGFTDFNLYNRDTTQIQFMEQSQRMDSITTEIVKACRAK